MARTKQTARVKRTDVRKCECILNLKPGDSSQHFLCSGCNNYFNCTLECTDQSTGPYSSHFCPAESCQQRRLIWINIEKIQQEREKQQQEEEKEEEEEELLEEYKSSSSESESENDYPVFGDRSPVHKTSKKRSREFENNNERPTKTRGLSIVIKRLLSDDEEDK